MAVGDENPFWRDEERRAKFFDWDLASGWYRRFFTIDELAGVRVEDPEVFDVTHDKVLELVDEGVVQGLRIDHPDGLADPRGYLERLRARRAARLGREDHRAGRAARLAGRGHDRVRVRERRHALFVDLRGEEPLTQWYADLTGESRTFARIAYEAKLEQARTDFRREFDRLESLLAGVEIQRPQLEQSASSLGVYRTYVEPWSGRRVDADRAAPASSTASSAASSCSRSAGSTSRDAVPADDRPGDGERGRGHGVLSLPPPDGAERSRRRPGRFTLAVDDFHRANEERGRAPTAPAGDADARRSGPATCGHGSRRSRRSPTSGSLRPSWRALDDPHEDELLWQTLVGTMADRAPRLESYLEKALREAKRNTNWIEPDLEHERRVKEAARRAIESRPTASRRSPTGSRPRGGGSRSG